MKAGIVTFNSAHNYGAVLQVFAMQEYLKSLGMEVDVINYRLKEIDNVYKLYNVKRKGNKAIRGLKKVYKVLKVNISLKNNRNMLTIKIDSSNFIDNIIM